jgi:hypothetical protein
MIICQPRFPVVLLIGMMLFGFFMLTGIWLYNVITSPTPSIFWLFVVCLVLSLLLFLTIRLAFGYKRIVAGKGFISIHYKLLGTTKKYPIADLTGIDEVKINTFKDKQYRQLLLFFNHEKISLNDQVYMGYDTLKKFLNENRNPRKQKSQKK